LTRGAVEGSNLLFCLRRIYSKEQQWSRAHGIFLHLSR
jgi:hypothetical protein